MRHRWSLVGVIVLALVLAAPVSLAAAVPPPSTAQTVQSVGFENIGDTVTSAYGYTVSGEPAPVAWWDRSNLRAAHAGTFSLWCAGYPSGYWPNYPENTRGHANLNVPDTSAYYESWISFWYVQPTIAPLDNNAFSVRWLTTPKGPEDSPDMSLNPISIVSSWTQVTIPRNGPSQLVSPLAGILQFQFQNFYPPSYAPHEGASVDDILVAGFKYGPVRQLTSTRVNTTVTLNWLKPYASLGSTSVDSRTLTYRVWRSGDGGATWTELTSDASRLTSPTYADTTADTGTVYKYAVQAWDTGAGTAYGRATEISVPTNAMFTSLTSAFAGSSETSITVPYGTVQSFAGVLSNYQGVPLGGQAASVELQSSANGADSWTRAAGAGEVSPSGTYQASAGQVTQGAYFRMHFLGTSNYTESTGAALHVNVAKANTAWAGVSSAPSAVLAGGTSVISGTLNSTVPGYGALAEKTSHVRVQRLSGGTSWVDDPAVASEDSPGHYRATVTVSSTSQYRLVFEGDVNFNTASSDPVQVAVVAPTSWSGVTEGYTVGYNGATLIARVLSGVTGIGGQTVVVQSSPSGLDGTWSNLGLAQEDLFTPGRYFAVVNTTRLTFYRLYFQGSDVYLQSGSPVTWVLSKASVGTPVAPSRVAHGRYFKVYGALYPAHPAGGKVLIKAYRYESRRWRLKQQFWVSAGAGTKYSSTRIKLRYAGSYRLYAYHADADHLATQSGYRRLTAY